MPSLTLSILVSLLAASTTVAQQNAACTTTSTTACSIPAATAKSSLSTLCQSSPNIPACDLSATSCGSSTTGPCDPTTLLYTACSDDAVPDNTAACTNVRSQCPCGKPVPELPTAKNASALVYSICFEMPQMSGCNPGCPAPDKTTLISNCKVLSVYGKLCIEMPMMNQCSTWTAFCAANNKVAGICTSGGASGTGNGNGTSTTTGTQPSQTNASSSAMAGFGASVIQLAVVIVVGITVLVA